MPSIVSSVSSGTRAEYISPGKETRIVIETTQLTADQVEQIMRAALEMICDARAVAKPRLTVERTRLALATALDGGGG